MDQLQDISRSYINTQDKIKQRVRRQQALAPLLAGRMCAYNWFVWKMFKEFLCF